MISEDFHRIAVITDSMRFSNEHDFSRGLCSRFRGGKVKYTHITTDNRRVSHSMIDLLMKEEDYDAVVTSNIRFAEKIRHVVENFSLEQPIPIFTLSSVTSLPEQDYRKYELNYGLLGRAVAETLIGESGEKQAQPEQLHQDSVFLPYDPRGLYRTGRQHGGSSSGYGSKTILYNAQGNSSDPYADCSVCDRSQF